VPESWEFVIQLASILANLAVRIAAMAAGVYVVWLGQQTLVAGVRGEFKFEGKHANLKASSPGLLFVLLGCMAVGWSLVARQQGSYERTTSSAQTEASERAGPLIPPPPPLGPQASAPAPEAP